MELDIEGWNDAYLVRWLDRKVRDPQIGQGELLAWLGDVVTYLTRDRELPIAQLIRCKFILARKLSDKIASIRQAEREKVYQLHLFAPDAKPEVTFDTGFEFFEGMYQEVPPHRGTKFAFSKHFEGPDRRLMAKTAAKKNNARWRWILLTSLSFGRETSPNTETRSDCRSRPAISILTLWPS